VQHRDSGRRFVVAWQNLKGDSGFLPHVTRLVDLVIEEMLR
jgi:hypothetical protein